MKIIIKNSGGEKTITIVLPTALVFSPASAAIASKYTEELNYKQMNALMKALRRSKRVLHGTPLVEVQSSGGEDVTIWL